MFCFAVNEQSALISYKSVDFWRVVADAELPRGERHAENSKATVYNTLNLFRDRGLIREVIVDPKRVFYDPNTEPHQHLYSVDTGEITDIAAAASR